MSHQPCCSLPFSPPFCSPGSFPKIWWQQTVVRGVTRSYKIQQTLGLLEFSTLSERASAVAPWIMHGYRLCQCSALRCAAVGGFRPGVGHLYIQWPTLPGCPHFETNCWQTALTRRQGQSRLPERWDMLSSCGVFFLFFFFCLHISPVFLM